VSIGFFAGGAAIHSSAMWKARRTTSVHGRRFLPLDKDVCSIVLEVPNSALWDEGDSLVARHTRGGYGGGWTQAERGARPAQAVLLPEERMLPRG